jgi:hypothetical protein
MQGPNRSKDFAVVIAILAVLAAAAIVALGSIRVRASIIDIERTPDVSPFGYTLSLALFLVPCLTIAGWFLCRADYAIERKATVLPVVIGFVFGAVLDVAFGNSFFVFRNARATLGVFLPGYIPGRGMVANIPIEEFVFYGAGFATILLVYVWANLYWFGAYCVDNLRERARELPPVARPHWPSLWVVLALLATGFVYRFLGPPRGQEGFPGYFTYVVIAGATPALVFFRTARVFVNWRAFSFTVLVLLFISLLWEVTLGVPYAWWGYRDEAMLGAFIEPWGHLPIEAVLVWVAACFGTVITYEVVRLSLHSDRPKRELLLGTHRKKPGRPAEKAEKK